MTEFSHQQGDLSMCVSFSMAAGDVAVQWNARLQRGGARLRVENAPAFDDPNNEMALMQELGALVVIDPRFTSEDVVAFGQWARSIDNANYRASAGCSHLG